MIKKLLLFLILFSGFPVVFAATYNLPDSIGSSPFNCSGSGPVYTCNHDISLIEDSTIILNADVTLNITGDFKAGEDFAVQTNGFTLNINATDDVEISGRANFTGNITAGDDIKIGEDSLVTGNLTAADNLSLDQDTVVNGSCSPSHPQCTAVSPPPSGGSCETFLDNFGSVRYDNQNGTVNWATDWIETGDNNAASDGDIEISNGKLQLEGDGSGGGHSAFGWAPSIEREADLSAYSSATLTFDYSESGNWESDDDIEIWVSSNGGSSWTLLHTFTNDQSASTHTEDLSAYMAADTRIAFVEKANSSHEIFYFDNVQIEACGASTAPTPSLDFHFDETAWTGVANEVLDDSANLYHASISTGSGLNTISAGAVCRAGQFDGSNDYIVSNDIFSLLRTTASMSFWIKTTQTGNDVNYLAPGVTGVEEHGGSDDIFWGWLDASGHIGISKWDTPSAKSTVAINDGNYHHIVLTRDSPTGDYKIYIDGVLDKSGITGSGDVGTSFSSIGGIENTQGSTIYLEGDLDEVMVFSSVLSDAQVAEIYSNQLAGNNYDGSPRFCIDSALVEWHFDESGWSGTSGEVVDSQGTLNATAVNGANTGGSNPAIAGDPGTCRYGSFDGTDDYVDLSGLPDLSGSFTVSAWIYANETGNDQRIFVDDQNNSNGFGLSLGDGGNGQLRFFARSVSPVSVDTQSAVISAGSWYHVAAVHNVSAKTRQIYVNGTAMTLTSGDTAPVYSGTWGVDTGAASIGGENDSAGEANANYRFNGNIDEVRVYQAALSASQITTVMNQTRPCVASGVDHFNINIGAGSGSTCAPFEFTVIAEDSSNNPVTDYSGIISITSSTANGNFSTVTASSNISPNPDNDDNGSASYTFAPADNGSISLALSNEHAQTLTISVVDSSIPATLSTTTNVTFSDNAFVISDADTTLTGDDNIPVAGRAHDYLIQMIRRNPSGCGVATSYSGDKDLKMWRSKNALDPSTVQPILDGDSLPDSDPVTANGSINFVQGEATVQLQTTDIGRYTINLADISNTFADVVISGTSIEQIIRPFGIGIDFGLNLRNADFADNGAIDGSSSDISYADNANGTLFTQAGEGFTTLISAVIWASEDDTNNDGIPDSNAYLGNNAATPSFGQEGETVTIAASNPRPGSLGSLSGTLFNSFVNGVQSQTTTYNNVGLFDMSAALSDGDYFGTGINLTGHAINVGRFNPHHYAVTAASVNDACGSFTYAGQTFDTNVTLEAQNLGNSRTDGYQGGYATLDIATELNVENSETNASFDTESYTITEDFSADTPGQASFDIDLSWNMGLQDKTVTFVNVIDTSDEVTLISASPYTLGSTEVRYGRLKLENVYGSELLPLTMPMKTQYFNGSNFQTNEDDNCTIINTVDLVVSSGLSGGSSTVSVISPNAVSGILDINLTPPGASNTGDILISVDLDASLESWLKFNWEGAGDADPQASATFGIYEGDSKQIFYQQVY